jgi:hypothetical protein
MTDRSERPMENFWKAVRQISNRDTDRNIEMPEATRRMRIRGADPLSDDEVAAIVLDVTGDDVNPYSERQRIEGWRQLVAALLIVSGLITTGAGMAYVFWPSSQYSTQTLSYDQSTYVLVSDSEPHMKRRSAMFTAYDFVKSGITTIRESASADPQIASMAAMSLAQLTNQLDSRPATQWVGASPGLFAASEAVLRGLVTAPAGKAAALQDMTRELTAGISCLLFVVDNPNDEVLATKTDAVLELLRKHLR